MFPQDLKPSGGLAFGSGPFLTLDSEFGGGIAADFPHFTFVPHLKGAASEKWTLNEGRARGQVVKRKGRSLGGKTVAGRVKD